MTLALGIGKPTEFRPRRVAPRRAVHAGSIPVANAVIYLDIL